MIRHMLKSIAYFIGLRRRKLSRRKTNHCCGDS
jgi:hypothetical protein